MPDFAPNFTPRYRVRYRSVGRTHRMQFRMERGETDPTAMAGKVGAFLAAIAGNLFTDWTVLSADFAAEDTDIFLPAVTPDPPTGIASMTGVQAQAGVCSLSFPGRSINGLRAILYVYGTNFFPTITETVTTDFRVLASEDAQISDGVAALNELSPVIVGNDGTTAIFYAYANVKLNDHWVRKARNG
jgi:hypothetical protein